MNKLIKGFTLIELMIVVAIMGILASIAYPSYMDHIRKTRRGDAKQTILALQALQERWFFTNNSYTNTLANLGNNTNKTQDGYYSVDIPTANANIRTEFTIRVNAGTGSQAADSACKEFVITQTGAKTATNSANADNTDVCWGK